MNRIPRFLIMFSSNITFFFLLRFIDKKFDITQKLINKFQDAILAKAFEFIVLIITLVLIGKYTDINMDIIIGAATGLGASLVSIKDGKEKQ